MPGSCRGKDATYLPCLRAAADIDLSPSELGVLRQGLAQHPKGLDALLPRTYRYLEHNDRLGVLDEETAVWLKNAYVRAIAGELVVTQWTNTIVSQLSAAGIPVILLKSAAFAGRLYPKDAPRQGRDIDLLVRECDFARACALLDQQLDEVVVDANRMATHEMLFERVFQVADGEGPTVEVHRGLTNPHIFSIAEQGLWERSGEHPEYANGDVRMLSSEDSLLHLAVHAFRDLDFCTHNLLDAHRLLQCAPPDWTKLHELAREWGARRVLYLLLDNCRELLSSPLPGDFLDTLAPSAGWRLTICRWIMGQQLDTGVNKKSLRLRLFQVLSQFLFPDSVGQGLRFQVAYLKLRMQDLLR